MQSVRLVGNPQQILRSNFMGPEMPSWKGLRFKITQMRETKGARNCKGVATYTHFASKSSVSQTCSGSAAISCQSGENWIGTMNEDSDSLRLAYHNCNLRGKAQKTDSLPQWNATGVKPQRQM